MSMTERGALPKHWEELVTDSGRVFYVDTLNLRLPLLITSSHMRKKCTWIDPRDNPRRPREADELPYGWSVAWDPECGEYFCDHISKKYTKRHPRTGLLLLWPEVDAEGRIVAPPMQMYRPPQIPAPVHVSPKQNGRGHARAPQSAHRAPATPSKAADTTLNSTGGSLNEADWRATGAKLLEVKQQFEANNLVLYRLRKDVFALTRKCDITEDLLNVHRPSPTSQADQGKRDSIFRAYASVNPNLLRDIVTAIETRGPLNIEAHIEHLMQFINDQHNEVEALRKLQTVLIPDGRSASEKLTSLEKLPYETLFQLFANEESYITSHQEKLTYFNRLLEYTDVASSRGTKI